MTTSKQAYNYIVGMIEAATTYFDFKVVDLGIDHFGRCFTEMKATKGELIDMRCDKWRETFQKSNIQSKTTNNETGA